ncbi:Cytochrome P450 6k1 [Dufourea novaeangliae]|uniref:Cytochrome P450 6k1 n=1 Tax=Dufourea novaeangliae TaxID=178035 RepID=A0A154PQK8_DUFNO|nr:Cytochrome P450 6k1 [Dufourea novaeangliae]
MALLSPYWGLDGIILFASLMVAAYVYATRNFKYWAKRGIMEIPPTPFIGNFKECLLLKKTPSDFVKELYDQSKGLRYMGFYIFDKPFFLIRDPELIKHVLVKDFNVFHDRYASPNVTDRLGYANVFMMKNPENGKVLEVKDICANFTTDMVGSTGFGLQVKSLKDSNAPFRRFGRTILDPNMFRGLELLTIFFMAHLTSLINAKFFGKEASEFLRSIAWQVINQRIQSGEKRNDLIDVLIELKRNHENEGDVGGFRFSGDDLVAQAAAFFSGGFETSSTTISFSLYELALNMDVQRTLRREILQALEETDGQITYEMVNTLPYLDMVVSETLRKYPPLGFLDRVAVADYKIPNSDVVIEKGTPVYVPMIGLHHDPEYFPDPEKFDPLRFNEENEQKRPNYTYFPFGEGPHICIGMRLGLLQSKLGLVQVLSKYEVTPCEKTLIPMVMDPKELTTTALGGIYLNVRKISTEAG